MGSFETLRDYLRASGDDRVAMSYDQLAELVGPLPPDAYRERDWWSNRNHANDCVRSWIMAGYRAQPNLVRQSVVFWKAFR